MLAAIRQKHPTIPIGLLMYAIVQSPGIDALYAQCSARRRRGMVLVADVPVEESARSPGGDAPTSRAISSARPPRMTMICARLPLIAAATSVNAPE